MPVKRQIARKRLSGHFPSSPKAFIPHERAVRKTLGIGPIRWWRKISKIFKKKQLVQWGSWRILIKQKGKLVINVHTKQKNCSAFPPLNCRRFTRVNA